jgi:hypothetical protein
MFAAGIFSPVSAKGEQEFKALKAALGKTPK